jgi:hypothetical protein
MSIWLKQENEQLTKAVQKFAVMQNLQVSKRHRLKRRLHTLLLSKRGLSTAFIAGMVRTVSKNKSSGSSASKTSQASKIAQVGLKAWLTGG